MTLKVLVVDDEPPARVRMRQLLAEVDRGEGGITVIEADGGMAALDLVDRESPAIVLLDIHMPGMNGIEVARHLCAREVPPAVIFVTAFDEHALEAFEVQAIDYLLKPVRVERLAAALTRAKALRTNEPRLEEVARALGNQRTHLTVSERGRMVLIPVDEIIYLRAELKYVTIRTAQREHLTEESLTSLETEFGERFVRIHRNALVARRAILGFQRVKGEVHEDGEAGEGHWEVMLKDLAERLPISRRQWPSVKAAAKS